MPLDQQITTKNLEKGSGFKSDLDWQLPSARTYWLDRNELSTAHDYSVIKIIDCGAYVTRDQIKQVADCRYSSACHSHGQMFFAGCERFQ